jgi:hypothetical protein
MVAKKSFSFVNFSISKKFYFLLPKIAHLQDKKLKTKENKTNMPKNNNKEIHQKKKKRPFKKYGNKANTEKHDNPRCWN